MILSLCIIPFTGTVAYKKPIDFDVWTHCYVEYARQPSSYFPEEFQAAAAAILEQDFHLTEEGITLENAETIFSHLVTKCS